jgi:hypothetical protein
MLVLVVCAAFIALSSICLGSRAVCNAERSPEGSKGRSLGFDDAEKLPKASNKSSDCW